MKPSTPRRAAALRVVGAGMVACLAIGLVSCGDDPDAEPSNESEETVPDTAAGGGSLLGEENAATGEPVKVGLITDGGDCAECTETAGDEQPVAEATVEWANEYLGGLGGRPMELVTCVDDLDPAKAGDCANQMIADDVVAVAVGSSGVIESSWEVLHEAGVPFINYSVTQPTIAGDDASTFILRDSAGITVDLPLEVAVEAEADVASVIVVDLPIALESYQGDTPDLFEESGVALDLVPVPLGTTDMTPQAQQIVSDNPDGVAMIVGYDAFCIPAINGLTAAGFEGDIVMIANCLSDATTEAIPPDVLDGIIVGATAPLGDESDESLARYNAVLDEYGVTDVDRNATTPIQMFSTLAALAIGTQGLEGEVTQESVIDAMRAMPNEELPGTGGLPFRCNGKANPDAPAICTQSFLSAALDAEGNPGSYEARNDDPIED